MLRRSEREASQTCLPATMPAHAPAKTPPRLLHQTAHLRLPSAPLVCASRLSSAPLASRAHCVHCNQDALFATLDRDGSGSIDFEELATSLRRDDIELDERLRDGAVAFDTESKNRLSIRTDAKRGDLAAPLKKAGSVEALKEALMDGMTRVVDLFSGAEPNFATRGKSRLPSSPLL